MFKAIKEFFTGKKVEEVQSTPPVITMAPVEVPYKVEVAPVVAVEKPAKKTRMRSSTPKAKIAKASKTKK